MLTGLDGKGGGRGQSEPIARQLPEVILRRRKLTGENYVFSLCDGERVVTTMEGFRSFIWKYLRHGFDLHKNNFLGLSFFICENIYL